ncbi:dGTP triphosphohydrolase [Roseateles sp.]|uniref:dGTP triphosphohydrolase n=1 Tax=Roseateles sp. TaxID=1971397 RepID=UPI0039E9339C
MENPLYAGLDQLARCSGNLGVRENEEGRDPFQKDYARLLHAPAFRRLQGKTQLFPGAESDFFRNRLTHSLEVAQIAAGIAGRLNVKALPEVFPGAAINTKLVEFAALAHDLGHPPFGHNGEHALDALMREHGGFEGNAQTLRILAAVERKLVRDPNGATVSTHGLDLTYRSLAAVLKYDRLIPAVRGQADKLAKGYYRTEARLVAEIKKRVAPGLAEGAPFKTIECAIMDIADDIAYSTYDLEDSLHAGFVSPLSLANSLANDGAVREEVLRKTNKALKEASHAEVKSVKELLEVIVDVFGIELPPTVIEVLDRADKAFVDDEPLKANLEGWLRDQALTTDPLFRTQLTAERVGRLIGAVELKPNKDFPQLSSVTMNREAMLQVEVLKHLNYELVIRSPRLAVVEHRGRDVVTKLFNTLLESKGALLPKDWRLRYKEAAAVGITEASRLVCDYVACMTDRYAAELHARLFGDGASIFKPL